MIALFGAGDKHHAHASLALLATRTGLGRMLSADSDFDIYRLPDNGTFDNLLNRG